MDEGWKPAGIGLRGVFRCELCGVLVHTAEARNDGEVRMLLRAHRTFSCRPDPLNALVCGAA